MAFIYNSSLKNLNTFGMEVNAKRLAGFSSKEDLVLRLIEWKKSPDELLILGGGSNILFTKDFDGTVLKNEIKGIELVHEDDQYFYLKAGAGEIWHEVVMYCVEQGYAGIENMALIPGCIGAAPMQNIGAYGVELKDVFYELEAVSVDTLEAVKFNLKECEFGYRESVFKRKLKNKFVIISVTLRLMKKPVFNTSYGNIQQQLDLNGVKEVTIKEIAKAVIQIRQSKLPDPAKIGNAGSFFKNPEIAFYQYSQLKERYPDIVGYPTTDQKIKVAAGWLIEKAGWKGKIIDNYGVHKNQALVLVNYGGANGAKILDLSGQIIADIFKKFGINLEREVNIY